MCRKYLFTLLDEAIQSAQNRIVSLIEAGDFAAANVAIEQMKTDFAGNKDLPDHLYNIACKYRDSGRGDLARTLYQDISQNYSEIDPYRATLASMWVKIRDLIDAGDYVAAESSIKQMKVNFARSEDLADSLLHFAWISEQQGQRNLARALYQDISQNYSEVDPYRATLASIWISRLKISDLIDAGDYAAAESSIKQMKVDFAGNEVDPYRATLASIWISRFDIYNLVDTGDYAAVESSIKQMKVDFAGNKELADHLYNVAWKCRESGRKDIARALYQDISQNYSEIDPYRATLASIWVSRLKICDLIDAGDYAAAKSSIKQMKVDFAKSEDLADPLLHFAWRCEQQGQRDIARELYQDVSQNYSGIDPYRSSTAAMYIAIIDADICKLVDVVVNDEAAIEATIAHLKSEFSSTHEPSYVMYSLAKVLHRKALAISAGDQYDTTKVRVRAYLKQAIAIYENGVIGKTDRADLESEAYRVSARSYEILEDYDKASKRYQQCVDKYPKDPLSWHIQFKVGRCYENMVKAGQISKSDAEPEIRSAYTQVLEKYPNCKAVTIARSWLERH